MRHLRWIIATIVAVLVSSAVFAQFGRPQRRGYRFGYEQNVPPNDSEFVFARWEYGSSGGWAHDYPAAEEHINQIMDEATALHVERMSYKVIPMESDEIFNYPFGYISEPGQMWLTEKEVQNFREFVDRGGFVMLDDFDGPRQFSVMRQNIQRVFPDRPMVPLTDNHTILNSFYDINSLYVESPYAVGGPAQFFGINDDEGDLSVIICFNNDVGDFWEWIDEPRYPLKPSAEALRLGVNIILYAMTH